MAKRTKCLILFFVFYWIASLAEAANWQHVASAPDDGGFDVYVDVESIQVRGDTREFWDKFVYKTEQEREGKKFIENRIYGRVNCSQQTRTYLIVVSYARDGKEVFRYAVSPEMVSVPPGSIGEVVLKFVCGPPK